MGNELLNPIKLFFRCAPADVISLLQQIGIVRDKNPVLGFQAQNMFQSKLCLLPVSMRFTSKWGTTV